MVELRVGMCVRWCCQPDESTPGFESAKRRLLAEGEGRALFCCRDLWVKGQVVVVMAGSC